jgi:hypothetical protein
MVFYLLAGFALTAIVFLVMIAVQLFKIEKNIADISDFAEHRVKKIYAKE